nr:hypothetical protein [Tanacetum cinerariifolium]
TNVWASRRRFHIGDYLRLRFLRAFKVHADAATWVLEVIKQKPNIQKNSFVTHSLG